MTSAVPPPALDWGHLQFFLAVAEGGSIQQAARRLGVNHSTVLRRIAGLEEQLGCRLFDRLPGGYALTAAGNHLAEHLGGLTEQMEGAERQVRGLDEALRGAVRVTSSDIVVEGLLMPLLAQFRRRHPQVQLQLVMNYGFTTLSKSEADIAVRGADEAPPNLVARRVGHVESVLCASPLYLQTVPRDLPLERQRWVVVDDSLAFGMFERWFNARVPAERVAVRVDSLVGVADAVAQGLGVGFLPRPLLRTRPDLVQLGPAEPTLQKPIWVLMHPDVQHTARVRALYRFLVDLLAADPQLGH
jgi:DNA-binding transcriptional LysR family regulator